MSKKLVLRQKNKIMENQTEFLIENYLPQKKAVGIVSALSLAAKNIVLNRAIKILLSSVVVLLPEFVVFILKNTGVDLEQAKQIVTAILTKLEEETTV